MNNNDIWYGFLQAGDKSSPVVRDSTLEVNGRNTVYLFNYARGKFLEYSLEIVEPKLRELQPGDISREDLESAFRSARNAFNPVRAVNKWNDAAPTIRIEVTEDPDMPPDLDIPFDEMNDEEDN